MYFDKIYRVDKVRVKGKVIRFCKELIAVGAYFWPLHTQALTATKCGITHGRERFARAHSHLYT